MMEFSRLVKKREADEKAAGTYIQPEDGEGTGLQDLQTSSVFSAASHIIDAEHQSKRSKRSKKGVDPTSHPASRPQRKRVDPTSLPVSCLQRKRAAL